MVKSRVKIKKEDGREDEDEDEVQQSTATVEMTRTPSRLLGRPVICRELRKFMDIKLWSSMQLLQVRVWKRFGELRRPEPNLIRSGYPSNNLVSLPTSFPKNSSKQNGALSYTM
ncbi:hypothetical protein NC653_004307 [Populus alba x Populus x berolinensis]|uniref:Uncharacterized protein n=1 Tax=Populus alba x Populus x berolinensis TaxID=444605 RepID=A0AAD6RU15_9ROSI|nr:hypothetical protein NC653_004307 [Populus alba x Populus x berolinensis]